MDARRAVLAVLVVAGMITIWAGAAGAGVDFTARLDNPYHPLRGAAERVIQIDVEATPSGIVGHFRRPPLNVALVLDRSGSMGAEGKMGYAVEAACRIVDSLLPGDRLAVVAYDNEIIVPVPSQLVEDGHRIKSIIRGLYPRNSTNLGEGLAEGLRQVSRWRAGGQVNRVILLSDGLANVGVVAPSSLSGMVADYYEQGVTVSTFGVGADFNEYLMTALATSGGGRYWFIASASQIPEYIMAEFRDLGTVEVLSARIIIRLHDSDLITVYGFPFKQHGRDVVIDLGDLPAGLRRRIMVAVRPHGTRSGCFPLGDVSMEYAPTGRSRDTVRLKRDLTITFTDDLSRVESSYDKDVVAEKAVVQSAVILDEATKLVDSGRAEAAVIKLKEAEVMLKAAPQNTRVQAETQRNLSYQGMAEQAPAMPAEEKSMMQKKYRSDTYNKMMYY